MLGPVVSFETGYCKLSRFVFPFEIIWMILGHLNISQNQLVISVKNDVETKSHTSNYGAKLAVSKGDEVVAGDRLTHGAISPKELLSVTDPITVQQYILLEIQKVYRSQGVDISDKHVEIIAKRMISRIKIINSGDSISYLEQW